MPIALKLTTINQGADALFDDRAIFIGRVLS